MQQASAIDGPDPDLAVFPPVQHQLLIALRQTHRNNCILAEANQSFGTANPNVALTIFEELIGEPRGEAVLFVERLQLAVRRTKLSISQSLGIPDSYDPGVHARDPQGALAIKEQIMQATFGDGRALRIRATSSHRDRSHLKAAVVRKPHAPVFGLRQCCNTCPDRTAEFECFRTSPQECNNLHGRYPERALTIDEEGPYHLRSQVPVVSDGDPSCALAQDQPSFGAGPDSSVMIAGKAMNG